jgi:anti-repressor protein
MSNLVFSQSLAISLVNSPDQFPVDFDLAWAWLGFFDKQTGKKSLDKSGFNLSIDYRLGKVTHTKPDGSFSHISHQIDLTTECFKKWAMMAGTEQGKQVRLYFLECEKIAQSGSVFDIPQNLGDALILAGNLAHERDAERRLKEAAQFQLKEEAPLVAYAKDIIGTPGLKTVGDFFKSIGMGRNTGFRILRERGIFMKDRPLPMMRYVDSKYFEVTKTSEGFHVALITPRGEAWVHKGLERMEKEEAITVQLEKTVQLQG